MFSHIFVRSSFKFIMLFIVLSAEFSYFYLHYSYAYSFSVVDICFDAFFYCTYAQSIVSIDYAAATFINDFLESWEGAHHPSEDARRRRNSRDGSSKEDDQALRRDIPVSARTCTCTHPLTKLRLP